MGFYPKLRFQSYFLSPGGHFLNFSVLTVMVQRAMSGLQNGENQFRIHLLTPEWQPLKVTLQSTFLVSEQTNNVLFLSFGDKLSQMFVALLKAYLGPTHGMVFQSIWLPKKFGPNAEFGHFLYRRAVKLLFDSDFGDFRII